MTANKEIVQAMLDRLDQRDIDGVLRHAAPDAVWHGFGPQPIDNAGYRQAIQVFLDAAPDSRFPITKMIAQDDRVAVFHSFTGTHRGNFQGVPPTGKPITVAAIAIFRLANGAVSETWLSADLVGLLMQIGAIPAPA